MARDERQGVSGKGWAARDERQGVSGKGWAARAKRQGGQQGGGSKGKWQRAWKGGGKDVGRDGAKGVWSERRGNERTGPEGSVLSVWRKRVAMAGALNAECAIGYLLILRK